MQNFLDTKYIVRRINDLKLADENLAKYGFTKDKIVTRVLHNDYDRRFVILMSLLIKSNPKNLFLSPSGKIF